MSEKARVVSPTEKSNTSDRVTVGRRNIRRSDGLDNVAHVKPSKKNSTKESRKMNFGSLNNGDVKMTDLAASGVNTISAVAETGVSIGTGLIKSGKNASNGTNDFGEQDQGRFGGNTPQEAQNQTKATVMNATQQGKSTAKATVKNMEGIAKNISRATKKATKEAAKQTERAIENTAKTTATVAEKTVEATVQTTVGIAEATAQAASAAAEGSAAAASTATGPVGLYIALGFYVIKAIIVAIILLIIIVSTLASLAAIEDDESRRFSDVELDANAMAVYEYLVNVMEYNDFEACATLANIYCESGFYPEAVNPSSGAYGICQWMDGRYDALCLYAEAHGGEPSDLQMQIEYMGTELAGPGWTRWDGTYDTLEEFHKCAADDAKGDKLAEATFWFVYGFERPALWDGCVEEYGPARTEIARDYYEKIQLYNSGQGGEALVAAAVKELGNEGGEKYWSWYGFTSYQPWCACFVSYMTWRMGMNDQGIAPTNSIAGYHAFWFRDQGRLVDARTVEPEPGWIIYFDWEAGTERENAGILDHVGIVRYVRDGKVHTIEGNSCNRVNECEYNLDDVCVVFYGVPDYDSLRFGGKPGSGKQ